MAATLLALFISQVPLVPLPCAPGDSTVVCHCKQGMASACEELAKVNPELLRGLLRVSAMAQGAKEARKAKGEKKAKAQTADSTGCGSGQDPNEKQECTGQSHHIISQAIWKALELHKVLSGKYTYRDSRFVAKAKDLEAHCGYQHWHKDLDEEIADWIRSHRDVTAQEFEAYLREVYARPELLARFPNGF